MAALIDHNTPYLMPEALRDKPQIIVT